jgi:hypothetical protein
MTAAAADRDTPRKYVERVLDPMGQKTATTIWAGVLVAREAAANYALPAADTVGLIVLGRSSKKSVGAGGDGVVKTGNIERGVFKFANAGANGITLVGETAYVVDDVTVGKAAATTNSVVAGTVDAIDADGGIWVAVGL